MTESSNVWVRTSCLEIALSGKEKKEVKRGLPSLDEDDEVIDWGWAFGHLIAHTNTAIEICIKDEGSPHNGLTVKLPVDSFKEGKVLMGNKYGDLDEYDEEDLEIYPDDLITLTHLHEPEVVHCLRQRYCINKIYTSTGPILLALNPFKNCKALYSKKVMKDYWEKGEQTMNGMVDDDSNTLPPHVYSIADNAFRTMIRTLEESGAGRRAANKSTAQKTCDQSILVSGESGAGKTVTTKFIMQYLATLSQQTTSQASTESKGTGDRTIEQQVLQSNPILESFGNARTIRNDNSSRFGKFIEIKFSREGTLVGASIETYLLEKVRLISQSEGERNYHIFYEVFCMEDADIEDFLLDGYTVEDFNMTNQSGTYDRRDGVDDSETYDDLRRAMETMGMTADEQKDVFSIPCAALHASNISFIAMSSDESALETENPHLEPFCKLMGISADALDKALCYLNIQAGREFHTRTLPKIKAEKGIKAFVKAFYGALFTFLVQRINESITVKEPTSRRSASSGDQPTIGVLDIFGFESFKFNSFEQLCINYCNEALQQQFNIFVLKNEQAEYDREGIEWSFISFPDNQDVLDLIDKKGSGILSILDDQCRAPGTTDKTFCIDLYKKCTGHSRFEADFRQVGAQKFGVKHYAGPVEYDTDGFVDKNRDELPKEACDLLLSSTKIIVQKMAKIISDPGAGSAGVDKKRSLSPVKSSTKVTVGWQFSRQLQELRAKIDLTSPHYVRCLKPNDLLIPDHFNPLIISDQLRYAGVIEAVRVSRVGYPQRFSHVAFVVRYGILGLHELKKAQRATKRAKPVVVLVNVLAGQIWKGQCKQASDFSESDDGVKKGDVPPNLVSVGIQVGKTKVFLRRQAYEILEQLRGGKMRDAAVMVQSAGRGYIDRRAYQSTHKAVIRVQCLVRMQMSTMFVDNLRRNHRATLIQTLWRKGVVHNKYIVIKAVTKWTQKVVRGRRARLLYYEMNRERKATAIQTNWRRYIHQTRFKTKIRAVVCLQCAVRSGVSRQALASLRLGARDLGVAVKERDEFKNEVHVLRQQLQELKAALSKLESRVAESTSSDELEKSKQRVSELSITIDSLKTTLDEVQQKCDVETKRAQVADERAEALREELDASLVEATELQQQFATATSELQIMMLKAAEGKEEIEGLEQRLRDTENDAKEAEAQVAVAMSKLQQSVRDAEDKSKEATERVAAEISELQRRLHDAEENSKVALSHLSDENNELQQRLRDAEKEGMKTDDRVAEEVSQLLQRLRDAEEMAQETERQVAATVSDLQQRLQEAEECTNGGDDEITAKMAELQQRLCEEEEAAKEAEDLLAAEISKQEALNEEILNLENDLDEARREIESALDEVDQLTDTNKDLTEKIETLSQSGAPAVGRGLPDTYVEEELEEAKRRIVDLENELNDTRAAHESSVEMDETKIELEELRNCFKRDAARAAKEIEELKHNLKKASKPKTKRDMDDAAAEEILALQDEINRLNKELSEGAKGHATIDENSPEEMMKRYSELRRLAEAGLEKDREIERLKAVIEELECQTPPEEFSNNEESEHLKLYIIELQKEISILSEKGQNGTKAPPSAGKLGFLLGRRTIPDEDVKEHDDSFSGSGGDTVIELEAEIDALKEVNEMLKRDVEKSHKALSAMQKELHEERERSKQELESFAKTLRGVDELRCVAESMSREVNKIRLQGPSNKIHFSDEIADEEFGRNSQLKEVSEMIDKARVGFEIQSKPSSSFWSLDFRSKSPPPPITPNYDDTEDDIKKLMVAKKKKKSRAYRGSSGSGNSIVSSFF